MAMSELAERFYVPVASIEQIRSVVRKEKWAHRRSAQELAQSWFGRQAIPLRVQRALDACGEFGHTRIVRGVFEHGDLLNGPPGPSRTDLMLHIVSGSAPGVIAIEGKVDEGFDHPVRTWLLRGKKGSESRPARLRYLGSCLGIEIPHGSSLRYQLIHRTVSAISEARRCGAKRALMLVHAFTLNNPKCDPKKAQVQKTHFCEFGQAMKVKMPSADGIHGPITVDGVRLWFGWVDDAPAN